jgi:hypothetical protein
MWVFKSQLRSQVDTRDGIFCHRNKRSNIEANVMNKTDRDLLGLQSELKEDSTDL